MTSTITSSAESGTRPMPRPATGGVSRPPREDSDPNRLVVTACALGILARVAFAPALAGDFVFLDDPANFLDNLHLRGLGWPPFAWAWRAHVFGVYQPLGWLIHSAEYAMWGPWRRIGRTSPLP
jgi:hypothetical protein